MCERAVQRRRSEQTVCGSAWRKPSSISSLIRLSFSRSVESVSSVIVGARDLAQLEDNLGAVGWRLDDDQVARLDAASHRPAPYPYFPYERQEAFARLAPPLVGAPA